METLNFTPIGLISSCYKEKFGIPRQPGLVSAAKAQLTLSDGFGEECIRELEEFFTYLDTDGTPVLDIKPYLPYVDAIPDAAAGYATEKPSKKMTVLMNDEIINACQEASARLGENIELLVKQLLELDPRIKERFCSRAKILFACGILLNVSVFAEELKDAKDKEPQLANTHYINNQSPQKLPASVNKLLKKYKIPTKNISVYIRDLNADSPMLELNADKLRTPASTMKLLTTYAALKELGPNYSWRTEITLTKGRCRNSHLRPKFKKNKKGIITVSGNYAAKCKQRFILRAVSKPEEHVFNAFRDFWLDLGGTLKGGLKLGRVSGKDELFHVHSSPTLGEQIRLINKWSNNVMTKQLLLTLGAKKYGAPGDQNDDADTVEAETSSAIENTKSEEKTSEKADEVKDASTANLATIDVTGVDSELKKNIELHMPVTIPECTAERGEVRQFFTTVKKHLRKASRALGYYDAEFVSGGSVVNNCWKLRLRITPGRPTKVSSIFTQVVGEGKNEKLFKEILSKPPYVKGEVLNHKKYTDFKTQLSEAAQTLGYYDAEFEQHSIKVDPTSYRASVSLVINTGKRYRYGKVTVDQKILSDKAMSKYISLKQGALFNAEDLINQQQLLQRSGYFNLIKVEVLHEEAKNFQVPVAITLTSKKRNSYKFKVGYGSDTGARVAVEMNRRYTGKSGRQLKFKAQYAEKLPEVSIQLLNPRRNPEDNSLVYSIDLKKDSNDDIESHTLSVGGTLVRKLKNGWIRSASVRAIRDKTQVDSEDETDAELLMFGVGLEKVRADSLLYPTDGWRLKLSLDTALEALLSDQDVTQLKVQAKGVKKFGTGRVLARMNLGSSLVSDFNSLPKSLRFFAGGSNSVRGYNFETLGETNDNWQSYWWQATGVSGSVLSGLHVDELSWEDGVAVVLSDIDVKVTKFDIKNDKIYAKNAKVGKLSIDLKGGTSTDVVAEDVDGELNMNQPHEIKTTGTAVFEHELLGKTNGNVNLSGTLTNYIFDGDLVLQQEQLGRGTAIVKGEGDYKRVTFNDVVLVTAHGNAEASGKVEWNPEVRWGFDVKAKNLTTNNLLPEWPAKADATLKYTGSYLDSRLENQLLVEELTGEFRGEELKAKGQITERESLVRANEFHVQLGNNKVLVNGAVTEPLNLELKVDAQSLEQISPEVSGKVEGTATIKGEYEKPEIKAKVVANNLVKLIAKNGNNTVNVTGNASEPFDLDLKVDVKDLKQISPQLAGSIKGNTVLKGTIEKPLATIDLVANGLQFNEISQGNEALFFKGEIGVDKKLILLKDLNVASGKNILQVNGKASEPLDLKVKINAQELTQVSPDLAGRIQGETNISGAYNSPKISTQLVASNLQFQDFKLNQSDMRLQGDVQIVEGVPMVKELKYSNWRKPLSIDGEEDERVFFYENAEINATVDNRTINTEASMKIVNRGQFSANAKLKLSPENGKHTIKGKANFDIPNINFAQDLIPHSRGLRGALSSKISFSGLLKLTAININVKADQPGKARINGKMLMGKGALNVTGDMDIKDVSKWKANIKIKGNNIRFMNTNEIKATMSPDIILGLSPQIVSIKGKVAIPFADIRLKDIPETSIDVSSDSFVVGERKPGEQVSAVKLQPNVKIELGDKLANGSLRVTDGKFQAYGQDLEINNGRLIFNGSPKLVGMDIRATRKIDDQSVGGHSLSTSSGQESALLMSAVRGLGITGNGSLIQNIGSSFGLDDVNIVTKEDLRESELALGKRLGSRLYVRYLVGLFDQTQKIAIKYKINKVLSLEAETTVDDYGLDFIYEIERD
ncbi:Translocation and assembly module subunit TamA [Nymphon striatum]|nr:Translocation and assembly module subunit TamA [Nymphon striatum]